MAKMSPLEIRFRKLGGLGQNSVKMASTPAWPAGLGCGGHARLGRGGHSCSEAKAGHVQAEKKARSSTFEHIRTRRTLAERFCNTLGWWIQGGSVVDPQWNRGGSVYIFGGSYFYCGLSLCVFATLSYVNSRPTNSFIKLISFLTMSRCQFEQLLAPPRQKPENEPQEANLGHFWPSGARGLKMSSERPRGCALLSRILEPAGLQFQKSHGFCSIRQKSQGEWLLFQKSRGYGLFCQKSQEYGAKCPT